MIDTALLFSGGKDSLACLYLYRELWGQLPVIWCNTGAAYPEMIEYMQGWKKKLPHFIEVKTDQPRNVRENGWPVDVLPVNNSALGRLISGSDAPLMQPYVNCCAENIWFPLHRAVLDAGCKNAIKGQRSDDRLKSTSKNGHSVYGITYLMPIEKWTEKQVFEYLNAVGAELPPGYEDGEKTGRDCWDCTAYLADNQRRIENLPEDRKLEIKRRLGIIDQAVREQWSNACGYSSHN